MADVILINKDVLYWIVFIFSLGTDGYSLMKAVKYLINMINFFKIKRTLSFWSLFLKKKKSLPAADDTTPIKDFTFKRTEIRLSVSSTHWLW